MLKEEAIKASLNGKKPEAEVISILNGSSAQSAAFIGLGCGLLRTAFWQAKLTSPLSLI